MNRIHEILEDIGANGRAADGAVTRIGFSPAYFEAVEATRRHMEAAGMEVTVDQVGNIRGRLSGADPTAQAIALGSHLDSVKNGGLFDGILGVAGAVECAYRLQASGKTLTHPLEVWGFNMEESSPLGGTFGSRAIMGKVEVSDPDYVKILNGFGLSPKNVLAARINPSDYVCYLELHIEQGDFLYTNGIPVGAVSGITGVVRYRITANGTSNHAGTTMMKNRRDALVSMARLILYADQRAREIDDRLVLTVGTMDVEPGQENVITCKAVGDFEMRHQEKAMTDRLFEDIRRYADTIGTADFDFRQTVAKYGIDCDKRLVEAVRESAKTVGAACVVMPSGAGHDANPIAGAIPVGMIFIPSKNGLSHCKEEWSDEEDVRLGTDVLYETLLRVDRELI